MSKQDTARDAIEALMAGYEKLGYVSDEQIATALFLAQKLEKPLLVEGPPGVGKTELAKATAEYLGLNMIRGILTACWGGKPLPPCGVIKMIGVWRRTALPRPACWKCCRVKSRFQAVLC